MNGKLKSSKSFYFGTSRLGLIAAVTALLLFLFVSPASSQPAMQIPTDALEEEQVEQPKTAMNITVKEGLLSVELFDAEFGSVIKDIADKAKFRVDISNNVAVKKISTTFNDVDVEKGIRRLLSIIREKDYTISYNKEGYIDTLEIFGVGSGKPVSSAPPALKKPPAPMPPRPVPQPVQPAPRVITPPYLPPSNVAPPPAQRPPIIPQPDEDDEDEDDNDEVAGDDDDDE